MPGGRHRNGRQRVNVCRRGAEKKPSKALKKIRSSKILHVKIFKSHLLKSARPFCVSHPTEPVNAWTAPPNWLHNRSHCTSLPSCIIWHLACISNAERSLRLQRRDTFVFCNKTLRSPYQQITTCCDFQRREVVGGGVGRDGMGGTLNDS